MTAKLSIQPPPPKNGRHMKLPGREKNFHQSANLCISAVLLGIYKPGTRFRAYMGLCLEIMNWGT